MKPNLLISAAVFFGALVISHESNATVYVVREGGVEVGRWEEADGSDKTEVIEQDAPKAARKKIKAPEPIMGEAGYQFTKPEIPKENLATFKIGGRVLDSMNLRAVKGGEITFSGGGISVKAPISALGVFLVELPKMEDAAGYTITVKSAGYNVTKTRIFLNELPLRGMTLKERVMLCNGVPMWTPISKGYANVEIGLCRDAMSEAEKKVYYDTMAEVTRGGEEEF